jgi:hypothetical protein
MEFIMREMFVSKANFPMFLLAFLLVACGGKSGEITPNTSSGPPATPVVIGSAAGPNADRPVFASESGGVYSQPWGAAGASWPEQLFWEDIQQFKDKHNEMTTAADSAEQAGRAPLIGNVAWGIDLTVANGGDAAAGLPDYSQKDGYKQYAAWMNARKSDYFALNSNGDIAYPGQGYITFGMPMLAADLPPGSPPMTFGEWAGARIGKMALDMHYRGAYVADYFIGINFNTDWHPRLVDSFASWANVSIPAGTVKQRSDFIVQNYGPQWMDFISTMQASYFVSIGNTLIAAGKQPRLGGQIANNPPLARMFGNDPRIWAKQLPGKDWFFMVETQSAGDRVIPPQWTSLYSIGATASREPDVPIGVMLDADNTEFWGNVTGANAANGIKPESGWRYLKHTWLASGWTHVANRDGSVRRGAQAFMRSYWDAGGTNPDHIKEILGRIPKHPFGPAMYYSANIERSFEVLPPPNTDTPNYYYFYEYLLRGISSPLPGTAHPELEGLVQGVNLGYWVSDAVDPAKLPAANKPSAWLLYNLERLPADERAKLEAVAPVYDLATDYAKALDAGPLRAKGSGLNMLAFVDQNSSVIVMVSNINATNSSGSLEFTNVGDGSFDAIGLLGTPSTKFTVAGNKASVPITVAAFDTIVFEIPKLKWVGH